MASFLSYRDRGSTIARLVLSAFGRITSRRTDGRVAPCSGPLPPCAKCPRLGRALREVEVSELGSDSDDDGEDLEAEVWDEAEIHVGEYGKGPRESLGVVRGERAVRRCVPRAAKREAPQDRTVPRDRAHRGHEGDAGASDIQLHQRTSAPRQALHDARPRRRSRGPAPIEANGAQTSASIQDCEHLGKTRVDELVSPSVTLMRWSPQHSRSGVRERVCMYVCPYVSDARSALSRERDVLHDSRQEVTLFCDLS